MLPLAASQAGSSGGAIWQESIVTVSHILAGPVMIGGFGVLVYELFLGQKGLDIMGRTKDAKTLPKKLH